MKLIKSAVHGWRESDRVLVRGLASTADAANQMVKGSVSLASQLTSRNRPATGLMADLHDRSPYKGFLKPLGKDLQTWGGRKPIFGDLVEELRPSLIIEVGTWKGGSAISLGRHMKDLGIPGHVLCVDTWLGSIEHWYAKDDPKRRRYYDSLRLTHGYPRLYEQFLVNVIHARLQDVIIPFPATSQVAAKWLEWKNVSADLIYIDAGHSEDDVYADLVAYHGLLADGGLLFGDDWQWSGVASAVTRFAAERSLTVEIVEDDSMFVLRVPEV